jgi:DNA invertase Pin-like site-specific DNA recombinase
MADARKGKFQLVLVWRFDRWARSSKHLVMTLEELHHLGIEFISYQENIDTSSPLGKAMFTIVAAIAELERNIIVERIRGGLRRAKAMGTRVGRPGLQMNVEHIVNLKTQGLSIRAIAKQVGASPAYVHKALHASRPGVTSV